MKPDIRYMIMAVAVFLLLTVSRVEAQPLYEQYLNTPSQTLQEETSQMGRELRNVFTENRIQRSQQRIDFADYYANFKKLILYGAKLANYADHEENLAFARDRELFRGLSSAQERAVAASTGAYDRKAFVQEKYEKMKVNVAEEIDTYMDLIIISLNACEIMSANDLSGFTRARKSRDTILRYMDESEAYQVFQQRRDRLENTWPDLARRISDQVDFWESKGRRSPEDPIIEPNLTGAIL